MKGRKTMNVKRLIELLCGVDNDEGGIKLWFGHGERKELLSELRKLELLKAPPYDRAEHIGRFYGNVNQPGAVLTSKQLLDQKIESVRKEMRDSLDSLRGVLCIDGKDTALALSRRIESLEGRANTQLNVINTQADEISALKREREVHNKERAELARRLCVLEKGEKRHDEHARWHDATNFGERITALEKQDRLCDDHCVAVDMIHNDIRKRLLALEAGKRGETAGYQEQNERIGALETLANAEGGSVQVLRPLLDRLERLENWKERVSKA